MSEERLTEEEARDLGPNYMANAVCKMSDEIAALTAALAARDAEVERLRAECADLTNAMREARARINHGLCVDARDILDAFLGKEAGDAAKE